jgi:hypothetical protein
MGRRRRCKSLCSFESLLDDQEIVSLYTKRRKSSFLSHLHLHGVEDLWGHGLLHFHTFLCNVGLSCSSIPGVQRVHFGV